MKNEGILIDGGAHENARLIFLEKTSKEQAARITELQSQVSSLAAQVIALTALVAAGSNSAAAQGGQHLFTLSEPVEGLAGKLEIKADDLGALPSEDLGLPVFFRTLLDREDAQDSKGMFSAGAGNEDVTSVARAPLQGDSATVAARPCPNANSFEVAFESVLDRALSTYEEVERAAGLIASYRRGASQIVKHGLDEDNIAPRGRSAKRMKFDGVVIPSPTLSGPLRWQDYLRDRVNDVPVFPVALGSTDSNILVSRKFISQNFGGGMRQMSVSFTDDNRRTFGHSYTHCLFPKVKLNAMVPRTPGAPGIMFLAKPRPRWPEGTQKLLVGLADAQFRYMGEYKFTRSEPLSPGEFCSLYLKVSKEWGRNLFRKDEPEERALRACRTLFKQLGRQPSEKEVEDALDTKEKYTLDPEDVREAFETEFWVLHTWKMECVGYDEDFQCRIIASLPRALQREVPMEDPSDASDASGDA
ncbi:uncharacterized protein TRAVEDRAFT_43574 [Trametes versicolor FP-101664 SS1]|uniref:uncharacterized protein n=1 Tax=Trametes versicolor (strain FP-101664) TaxID=717944 RepID=UPI00046238A0|nr:uncharacterized protein TRAVEDRAFT_43574 [Trametes versicolor FP-101664 SS1]EIW63271.1 hypothetical protein TRAVEDRAFT_43574 [Trametes versicolor FP-101664 SS1]